MTGENRVADEEDGGQDHGGHNGHRIGLEQISGHAGAVAYIVTHVIGDCSRIAWVVLGDTGFHLANQITADVSTFGEYTSAQTGKDGNQ